MQCPDAFASKIAFTCMGQDRLGSKTVLDPERILHDPSEAFVLNLCHASKITNEFTIRKLKIPERGCLSRST